MSLQMKVPSVGESIAEVTIAQWVKQDGDYVEMDEVIAELESDKATFELTAEAAGVLRTKAEEGDSLEIGAVICEIEESAAGGNASAGSNKEESGAADKEQAASQSAGGYGSASEKSPAASEGSPSATGKTVEMSVPAVGESINEVVIAGWSVQDGDLVALDDVIAEIESDKATFELTAEASGKITILAEEGATLEIGAPLCKIEEMEGVSGGGEAAASGSSPAESQSEQAGNSGNQTYATGHASPAASKILAEKGIDSGQLKGTGKDGRITKADALGANVKSAIDKTADNKDLQDKQPAQEAFAAAKGDRTQERKKMTSLRKTISRRLVSVKNETAMLTTFNEVNMKPIMDLRKKYKEAFKEKHEVGLGFMSFFTKASCMALQEWPAVNAMIDGNEMVYNNYCDISIAVSSPKGLVVPVIRNAEKLDFQGIEKEVVRLAKKARDGKLSIEEMTGGTFTLTNGGIFGSMMSTPIINAPQSAILGMHNIVERPVVENGEIVIRPIMYLALSYDHRIIDGRESVSFLVRVKQLLEDPARLMLGV